LRGEADNLTNIALFPGPASNPFDGPPGTQANGS
jgi:hypothetical protein